MMSTILLDSVRTLAARTGILERGSTTVVAVSGGQDSCALLHALSTLRPELHLTLYCAHLDHGFRGEDSRADAEFVRELAASLAIPATVESQDVAAIAARLHLSSQEAARRVRHEFLERVADSVGAGAIALGHTRDDRVETVLMNIVRGTGVDGLAGLTPRSGRRIRPLLGVSRGETAAYCIAHGIAFRVDASNESTRYTRNRVRNELLRELEANYNPGVRRAILRLADLAEQDSAALEAIASDELCRCTMNTSPGSIVLSTEGLRARHLAIQRRMIRQAISQVRGSLHYVDAAAVERALNALYSVDGESSPRFQFTLPHGDILVEVTGTSLRVAKVEPDNGTRRIQYELEVPGRVETPEFGCAFDARFHDEESSRSPAPRGSSIRLDLAQVEQPLTIRNRRPGDRLRPRGLGGSKKVQDILTDAKVPAAARDRIPLVCDARGVLWVPGLAVDERCANVAGSEADSQLVVEMIGSPVTYNPVADS